MRDLEKLTIEIAKVGEFSFAVVKVVFCGNGVVDGREGDERGNTYPKAREQKKED